MPAHAATALADGVAAIASSDSAFDSTLVSDALTRSRHGTIASRSAHTIRWLRGHLIDAA